MTESHAPNGPYPVCLHANESFVDLPAALKADLDAAYRACDIRYYPDPESFELRSLAAEQFAVGTEQITAGNGSDELIDLVFRSLCRPGDAVLIFEPDFGVYRQCAELQGLEIHSLSKAPATPIDPTSVLEHARKTAAKLIIFSNPCNPTGALTSRKAILDLLQGYDGYLVVDEAYMDFSDQSVLSDVKDHERLIVLKTLSKAFGAAGLRIGFSISSPEIAERLAATAPLYNVGRLNQELAACFFKHPDALADAIDAIKRSSAELTEGLQRLSQEFPELLEVYPAAANFIYMESPRALELFEALKERGVLIRSLGPAALRVCAGSLSANERFLKAFSDSLKELTHG